MTLCFHILLLIYLFKLTLRSGQLKSEYFVHLFFFLNRLLSFNQNSIDFPIVSFIKHTKIIPMQQLIPRNNMKPCKCIISNKMGKNFSPKRAIALRTSE